jgi:hypothetical protein
MHFWRSPGKLCVGIVYCRKHKNSDGIFLKFLLVLQVFVNSQQGMKSIFYHQLKRLPIFNAIPSSVADGISHDLQSLP